MGEYGSILRRLAKATLLSVLFLILQLVPASSSSESKITETKQNKLAILLASPWKGKDEDLSMLNDITAMKDALIARGFKPWQILSLEGELNAPLLLEFMLNVHKRIETWTSGEVFLYYTGHGSYARLADKQLAPGLLLNVTSSQEERFLSWQSLIDRLAMPASVSMVVLPDS